MLQEYTACPLHHTIWSLTSSISKSLEVVVWLPISHKKWQKDLQQRSRPFSDGRPMCSCRASRGLLTPGTPEYIYLNWLHTIKSRIFLGYSFRCSNFCLCALQGYRLTSIWQGGAYELAKDSLCQKPCCRFLMYYGRSIQCLSLTLC